MDERTPRDDEKPERMNEEDVVGRAPDEDEEFEEVRDDDEDIDEEAGSE